MPPPGGSTAPLPAYDERAAVLFDDGVDPAAVGLVSDASSPADDQALLRERTQTGDAVLRARVVTVTSSDNDVHATWQVGLRPLETLAGKHPRTADFTFRVGSRTPAAGIVRSLEGRLVGTTFVVFLRQFAGAPDDARGAHPPETHFHFEKDDKTELEAVEKSALLGQVH